jgi:hypothetical protein
MSHFAYKVMKATNTTLVKYQIGAFQPTGSVTTWGGWDWVDDTPNANIDCGGRSCGRRHPLTTRVHVTVVVTVAVVAVARIVPQGYGTALTGSQSECTACERRIFLSIFSDAQTS